MSDEESFVILGSSPLPSLEQDGINCRESKQSSLQSDTPGSRFSSLKNSQITELQSATQIPTQTPTPTPVMEQSAESKLCSLPVTPTPAQITELQNAREISTQTPTPTPVMEQSADSKLWSVPVTPTPAQITEFQNAREISTQTPTPTPVMEQSADSKLWSIPVTPTSAVMEQSAKSLLWSKPQVVVKEDLMPVSLEDCALKSHLEQNEMEKENPKESLKSVTISAPTSINTLENSLTANNIQSGSSKSTPTKSVNNSLASNFIMGDVNADVLKTSVYSQFPSISMEACAEDVVKLQNMVTEYMQLKNTLDKVNNTMKLFYTNSMQWKEKMNQMENHYKQQLDECQKQIEMLRKENQDLKQSFDLQVEHTKALDVARQKDREETIQEISEKNALLENMRAQIVKLEKQQLASFEVVPKKANEKKTEHFDDLYVTRGEHELQIKELQQQSSELLASTLDFKGVEKQYLDELNCLKVNLTSAEELIKQHRAEIAELRALDMDKQQKIEELEKSNNQLLTANAEQNERIVVLEQQNEVHRNDFEMERESRQTAMGEKQQILQDLRALQKKNQDLIEDRQNLVESYERRVSTMSSMGTNSSFVAAAAAAQSYIDSPQRPIRALPQPTSDTQPESRPAANYPCPICNKVFKSLNVLQSHVNDCIDKY